MVERTIRMYLWLTAFSRFGLSFSLGTYVLFLRESGLDLFEINMVNFVFYATLFLAEVPTGVVADVFGRKISFVCSCVTTAAGLFVYAASHSFLGFAAGEALCAIGMTFSSGAFQAWLVDSLKFHGYNGSLQKIFSREQVIMHATMVIGAIIGAKIGEINLAIPWAAGGAVTLLVGVAAAIYMREDYWERKDTWRKAWVTEMRGMLKSSWQHGLKNEVIKFTFVISTVQVFATQGPNMQWQPMFAPIFPGVSELGLVWSSMVIAMVAGSSLAPSFLGKVGSERKALLYAQVFIGLGITLTAALAQALPIAFAVFLGHELARGLFQPLKNAYLHDHLPSKERATLVSMESISHHLGGAIGLILTGLAAKYWSIATAWLISGSLLAASVLIFRRKRR